MAVWSRASQLTASCLSSLPAWVPIPDRACEKVVREVGLSGVFCRVFRCAPSTD